MDSTPVFATTNPLFAPMNPPVLDLDRTVREADCLGRTLELHPRARRVGGHATSTRCNGDAGSHSRDGDRDWHIGRAPSRIADTPRRCASSGWRNLFTALSASSIAVAAFTKCSRQNSHRHGRDDESTGRRRDSQTRVVDLAVDDDGRTAAPFASPISRAIPRGATRTTPQDRAASVHARTLGSHERALDRPARFSDRHPGIVERHCSIAHRPSRIADSRAPMSHSHRTSPKRRRLFGTECAGVSRGRRDRAASRAITDL